VFYPANNEMQAFILCSADNTASFWIKGEDDEEFQQRYLANHKGPVTSASFHPLKDYCLTVSKDATWSFHNMVKGVCLLNKPTVSGKSIEKVRFHPDGIIFGTCEGDGVVRVWDVLSQENVASFECHKNEVSDITFSENGYYLANCSKSENVVKLWDLRKPSNFKTLSFGEKEIISHVEFDFSGNFLGVAGTKSYICTVKDWSVTPCEVNNSDVFTGFKFGKDCKYYATSSMDRHLRISK